MPHSPNSGAKTTGSQENQKIEANRSKKITFGVAPATVATTLGLRTPLDSILLATFVLSGLVRLARFNVTVATLPKDASGKSTYFEGTPIPTTLALDAMMAYWVSKGWILADVPWGVVGSGWWAVHPVVGIFVVHGCCMTSRSIRIPKP